jgi:hypothetical protein
MADRPIAPRSVKPRKTGYRSLPIIAVSRETDEIFVERTGETLPFAALPVLIATHPSSIVVSSNVGALVKVLDDEWDADPAWQFRLTPVTSEIYAPNRVKTRTVTKRTVVSFFGFTRGRNNNLYHFPLEPDAFVGRTIHELRPGNDPRVIKLYEWASDVRFFLQENDLLIRPTTGGIAGQLLRDKRFYDEARRKVPKATNDKARDQLPGNYYRLFVPERKTFDATYLDQKSAHHSCALGIAFPDANSLFAKGHFQAPAEKIMARAGTKRFERLIREYGLFLVNLSCPDPSPATFPLPCMEEPGTHAAWVFSNELPYILECGGKVLSIIAQWTSAKAERGMNRYAEWSLAELAESDDMRKAWLKPLLHSTYGILAARPKPIEFGYKRAKNGIDKRYPVGGGVVHVKARVTNGDHEMPTASVIHRGMIEAETRLRSIRLAKQFHRHGMQVLAIYADSIFVSPNGKKMPLIDTRWHVKGELSRLQFFSSTSFTSDVLTKLPGIPRGDMDTVRRLEKVREGGKGTRVYKERARLGAQEPDSTAAATLAEREAAADEARHIGSVRPVE